jgi:hypothetical protein
VSIYVRVCPASQRIFFPNSVKVGNGLFFLTYMLSHAMSAGLFHAGVIEAIDKHRCAFLWTSERILQWRTM